MIRLVAIAVVVLAGRLVAPCQSTFIVHMDSIQDGYAADGRSILETDSGYIILGHQISNDGSGRTRCVMYRLGPDGGFIDRSEIGMGEPYDSYFGLFDPSSAWTDSGFTAIVHKWDEYASVIKLARFNGDGVIEEVTDVLDIDPLDSAVAGTRQLRPTIDGGYVFCGFTDPPDSYADAWLVKLDSSGAVQWEQNYGHPDQSYEAISVSQYPDGGYVLAGYRLPGNLVNLGFLIRTDSLGNQIWRRHFGEHGGSWGAVRVAADGGIITFSNYMEQVWPWWGQQLLTKWDAQGSIVWQTHSHYGYDITAYDLEILDDQRIVTCGRYAEWAELALYSAEGDSLWSRHLKAFDYAVSHLPYDVEPTSDGGFVLTGGASQNIGDPTPGLETIFVIKTDSLGCVVPGCQNVGVQEYLMDLQNLLRVSPNPASDLVNIALDLPEGGEVQGQVQAYLLDASGRLVLAQEVQQNLNQLRATFDVSALPAGTYYLHLRDAKRWLAGSKLVVE